MSLPVSLFLHDLEVLSRHAQGTPRVSVVISPPRQSLEGVAAIFAALSRQDMTDLEFLVLDDGLPAPCRKLVTDFWSQEGCVTVLRFPRCRGIPAVGVNAALQRASGRYIAYQTGAAIYSESGLRRLSDACEAHDAALACSSGFVFEQSEHPGQSFVTSLDGIMHRRALLEQSGWADPHLLLVDHWADDLGRRLLRADQGLELAESVMQPLLGPCKQVGKWGAQAQTRPRIHDLRSERFQDVDVLDTSFMNSEEERLLFCDEIVSPYVASHWQDESGIHPRALPYAALRRPIRMLMHGGGAGQATLEICYGNFQRAFPDLLHVRVEPAANKTVGMNHDEHILVNFKIKHAVNLHLHQSARAEGKAVVYAMDDNLLALGLLPYFGDNSRFDSDQANLKNHLSDADLVLSWSTVGAEDVHAFNPRVSVLRTNIQECRLAAAPSLPALDRRVVYATLTSNIITRADWWQKVVREWRDFFWRHAHEARLVLFQSQNDKTRLLYKEWFHGLAVESREHLPYLDFLTASRHSGFHAVLAHVGEVNRFTQSKCPCKFTDATACGAILIATDMQVYDCLQDGVECLKVADRPGAWSEALERSLALGHTGRSRVWAAARKRVERDFTTESQYYPFFLAHEAGRMHASLKSGSHPGGIPSLLVVASTDSFRSETVRAWASLLARQHIRPIFLPSGTHDDADIPQQLEQLLKVEASIAVLLAPSPDSGWIPAARRAGLSVFCLVDIMDVLPLHTGPFPVHSAHGFLAGSLTVAQRLRAHGCDHVLRLHRPMTVCAKSEGAVNWFSGHVHQLRIGLLQGPDQNAAAVRDLMETAMGYANLDLRANNAPRELLVVAGHGALVVDGMHWAMAKGIPVVALGSADADEILVHGQNGWSLPLADAHVLAQLFNQVATMRPEDLRIVLQNAQATAHVRTLEEVLLMNLTIMVQRVVANTFFPDIVSSETTSSPGAMSQLESPGNIPSTPNIRHDKVPSLILPPAETLAMAKECLQIGQIVQAAELYQTILIHHPEESAFLGLSRALLRMEEFQAALHQAVAGLERFPTSSQLWSQKGRILARMQQWTAAKESFCHALELNDRQIDALVGLARIAKVQHDWNEALDCWEKCLSRFPRHQLHLDWLTAKAEMLIELMRIAEAETVLENLLRHEPNHSGACEAMARLATKQERWSEANHGYARCVALFPGHPRIPFWLAERGSALLHMGDFFAAEEIFRNLITDFPEKTCGHNGLQWVRLLKAARVEKEEAGTGT